MWAVRQPALCSLLVLALIVGACGSDAEDPSDELRDTLEAYGRLSNEVE